MRESYLRLVESYDGVDTDIAFNIHPGWFFVVKHEPAVIFGFLIAEQIKDHPNCEKLYDGWLWVSLTHIYSSLRTPITKVKKFLKFLEKKNFIKQNPTDDNDIVSVWINYDLAEQAAEEWNKKFGHKYH
jgi:hypothetical protein